MREVVGSPKSHGSRRFVSMCAWPLRACVRVCVRARPQRARVHAVPPRAEAAKYRIPANAARIYTRLRGPGRPAGRGAGLMKQGLTTGAEGISPDWLAGRTPAFGGLETEHGRSSPGSA